MADESDERMFDVIATGPVVEPPVRPPVDKTFRPYDPDQMFLMPPSLAEWLPEDHLGERAEKSSAPRFSGFQASVEVVIVNAL